MCIHVHLCLFECRSPPTSSGQLPRDMLCTKKYIKNDRFMAGKTMGDNYYNACQYIVNSAEQCCSMCQGNSQCSGYTYERADCSGFGGPINTGVCFQLSNTVVSYGVQGITGGSLNPFTQ